MNTTCTMLALIGNIGWAELLIIGIVALLIFGGRLPDVAKNLGKGIVEFKKGLAGIEDEIHKSGNQAAQHRDEAPRIDPPPQQQSSKPAASASQQQASTDSQTHSTS